MVIRFRPFEETEFDRDFWHMFWVSLALHLAVIFFIALARKIVPLPIYYAPPSATTVDLVAMGGPAPQKTEALAKPKEKPLPAPPKPKVEEKIPIPDVKKEKEKEKKAPETAKKTAPVKEKPAAKDYSNKDIQSAIENLKKKMSAKEEEKAGQEQQAIAGRGTISNRIMEIRYKTYYSTIWEIIRDAWIIPQGIPIEHDMETILGIVIEKQGRITDIAIEKSSGNQAFDDSAVRAIEKSSPLPPIPGEEEKLPVGIRFTPEDYQ